MSSVAQFQFYKVINSTVALVSNDSTYFSSYNDIKFKPIVTLSSNHKFELSANFHTSLNCISSRQEYGKQCHNQEDLLNHVLLSLVNSDGAKYYSKEFKHCFDDFSKVWTTNFIKLEVIKNEVNKLLQANNKMKFLVEIAEIEEFHKTLKSNMPNDFGAILESGKFSDMTFVIGEKKIPAHKAIVCARSPVLASYFNHECQESKESKVVISDMTVEVFEEFIRFIYTNQVKQMEQYGQELLVAADKYEVSDLVVNCTEYFIDNITIDTVVDLLIFADKCNIEHLKSMCCKFIVLNLKEVMATESWQLLKNGPQIQTDLHEILNVVLNV